MKLLQFRCFYAILKCIIEILCIERNHCGTKPCCISLPILSLYGGIKDIDELSLRLLIESSLNDYLDWEEQTCEVYKNAACILKDNLHFLLYRKVCSLIEEVENEKQEVKNLIAEATTYDYNPTYFK